VDAMRFLRSVMAISVSAAVVVPAVSSADGASTHVFMNINGYGAAPTVRYRPARLDEITGDGTAYVTRINWHRWNHSVTTATARLHLDDCSPDCADGKFSERPTRLRAWRIRYCPAAGRPVYTRLTIRGATIGGRRVLDMSHDCNGSS